MHSRPPSSIHLHSAHFTDHPALCNTVNNIIYPLVMNQNIARNWAISPNLGRKIRSCPFWLKLGTHGILEVLIRNQDLDFWNSDSKIHFWVNVGPKIQSCPFCLKIGAQNVPRILIPNPGLDFWNFDPKIYFWANLAPKT